MVCTPPRGHLLTCEVSEKGPPGISFYQRCQGYLWISSVRLKTTPSLVVGMGISSDATAFRRHDEPACRAARAAALKPRAEAARVEFMAARGHPERIVRRKCLHAYAAFLDLGGSGVPHEGNERNLHAFDEARRRRRRRRAMIAARLTNRKGIAIKVGESTRAPLVVCDGERASELLLDVGATVC